MCKKLLSVVIPTYNMEQYLPQCLDSITRADVPDTLEAIVVNDGSTDNSLEIAKQYQEKRPDIIRIIDKSNGHYGSCINAALKIATGKYFRPLDADDWFDTDALIQLLKKMSSTNEDLIITSRVEITNSHTYIFRLPITENQSKKIIELSRNFSTDIDRMIGMHAFTYKTSLLQKINLKLQEGICYTDTEYYLIPFQFVQKFIYYSTPLYYYRLERVGQSTEQDVFKKNRRQFASVLKRIIQETSPIQGSVEFIRLNTLVTDYFRITLFDIPSNKKDNEDMTSIFHCIKEKCPTLWNIVNKNLLHIPNFWAITKHNFHSLSKIKRKFFA